jgi:hypothetical protein
LKKEQIYIYHHLGLGDHISCNGLIRSIIKKRPNSKVFVFCKKRMLKLVSYMFRDDKRINIIPIYSKKDDGNEYSAKIKSYLNKLKTKHSAIKIGFENYNKIYSETYTKKNPITYDMAFYKQIKLSYDNRFSMCYWKREKKQEERVFKKLTKGKKEYAFVHDDPSLGYKIDRKFVSSGLKIIENDKSENIFYMSKVIEKAKEIHLMESSIRNMSESLNFSSNKIYLYIWRRRKMAPIYSRVLKKVIGAKQKWKIVYMNPRNKNLKFYFMNFMLKFRFYISSFID